MYLHKMRNADDPFLVLVLALLFFVPTAIEIMEAVPYGSDRSKFLFICKCIGVVVAIVYVSALWYFLGVYDKDFLSKMPPVVYTIMNVVPAAFLMPKIVPVLSAFVQAYNRKFQK